MNTDDADFDDDESPHRIDDDSDYDMRIECPYCNGDGWVWGSGIGAECAGCGGTGWE